MPISKSRIEPDKIEREKNTPNLEDGEKSLASQTNSTNNNNNDNK